MSRSAMCPSPRESDRPDERGSSLVAVLAVLALAATIAAVLTLLSSAEARIAAADRDAHEARYAAESGLDRALVDLQQAANWDDALQGVLGASFAVGGRQVSLADGRPLDLDAETSLMQARTDAGSAIGPDTPRWRLYGWGRLHDWLPPTVDLSSPMYVAVWLADDEGERDGRPDDDSNQALWVRAVAYGPLSTRRSVEALVLRTAPPPVPLRRLVWRESAGG